MIIFAFDNKLALNILYLSPYKYLKPTNGGEYCQFYSQQAIGKESNLFIAGVEANEHISDAYFEVISVLPNSRLRYINPLIYFKFRNLIIEKKIEVLIIEHPYFAWLAFLLKHSLNIKWVIRSVNIEYYRFKSLGKWWWKILRNYETWAHKNADFVWCITEEDKKQIRKDIKKSNTTLLDFPYGSMIEEKPSDKFSCKKFLHETLNIPLNSKIILFNGALDYVPNRIGLDAILEKINPFLQKSELQYKIIICGSRLPKEYKNLESYKDSNIIYCGFVDDISIYLKGADLFLNPIVGGGGIKTKLVETLAYNTPCISSYDGAKGIKLETVGNMLKIVNNHERDHFSQEIIQFFKEHKFPEIPAAFYEYYSWDKNVKILLSELK